MGQKLFDAANEPKTFVAIPDADHNNWLTDEYLQRLDAFIESVSGMGWWYPAFLCLMIVAMYMDYGGGQKTSEQNERKRVRNAAESVRTSEPTAPHDRQMERAASQSLAPHW